MGLVPLLAVACVSALGVQDACYLLGTATRREDYDEREHYVVLGIKGFHSVPVLEVWGITIA